MRRFRTVALVTGLLAGGCAPAYHSYSDCRIDCRYCPPPPLPYTQYEEAVCHSCVAKPFLFGASTSVDRSPGFEPLELPDPDGAERGAHDKR